MKGTMRRIGFIAVVAIVSLGMFTSCDFAPEDQIGVRIYGIPASYNDNYFAYGGLATASNDVVAAGLPKPIRNGSVTCDMLDKDSKIFGKDGSYRAVLVIITDQNDLESDVYSGVTASLKSFKKGQTTEIDVDDLYPLIPATPAR